MADTDLTSFIEDRLQALIPNIDLDPGSPAQVQFITPLLTYLGTDPFETDIQTFILDRFQQEYPTIFGNDPSAVGDLFVKPLILMLTPFKREIQEIKIGQTIEDPTVLSDNDANAIAANFFETRDPGGFSVGTGRLYFTNPTNIQIEITTRFFDAGGLNFFPTSPLAITAEQMVFNQSGSLYFVDVPLKAEQAGSQYNIDAGDLSGVDGIFGPVKVTNLNDFEDGTTPLDTPTFLAQTQESLTERSLVTRRGGTARVDDVFQGQIVALEIVGAKDPEMQRDILVASAPGQAWAQGQVSIYGSLAFVQCEVVDGSNTDTPQPGDNLYVYLDKYSYSGTWATLDQSKRMVRLPIVQVLEGPLQVSTAPYQEAFLVQFSGAPPTGVTLPNPAVLNGGFLRIGSIQISSLPDVGAVDLSVPNESVHVYGHTDYYVRPVIQTTSKALISNLTDDPIELNLQLVTGSTTASSNAFTDTTGFNFQQEDVQPGNLLTIETGNDTGTYTIGQVVGATIYLTANLTTTATGLRYRITQAITINEFDPKIPKLPFGAVACNDLRATIGIAEVTFATNDLLSYGAVAGDTLRILSGPNAGDYTILSFVNGKDVFLDRALPASGANITYQVFTALSPVELPLVRIKAIQLLDSAQQSTGISIPYGLPIGNVPTSNLTSAFVRAASQRNSGFVLPALTKTDGSDPYVSGGNVASTPGGRYSLGIDPYTGTYKAFLFDNAAQAEFDFVEDASTPCTYFLATSENTNQSVNYPPVDPQPGDALTIKNGPNAGSYLIQSIIKFPYFTAGGNQVWLYFLKIYGTFPVDVFRSLIEFLDANGAPVTKITNSSGTITFPDFFVTTYNNFGTLLNTALLANGAASPGAVALQSMVDTMAAVEYEWGDPARGVIRSYFQDPVLFEQNTALNEELTTYSYTSSSGQVLEYVPDPRRYSSQEIIPANLTSALDPLDYPRDLDASGSNPTFTDSTQPSALASLLQPGDILEVHEENTFYGGSLYQTAVQTTAGSNIVTAPAMASGNTFNDTMIGDLLFIDETNDRGGYYITAVPDAQTLVLSEPLTVSTPAVILQGQGAHWGYDGTNNKLFQSGAGFDLTLINQYVTIYGIDYHYQGSFKIIGVPSANELDLDLGGLANWPAYPVGSPPTRWVITTPPPGTLPNPTATSTELYGVRPIRMYNEVPTDFPITAVSTDPANSYVVVTGTVKNGYNQPFHILRNNIRRITPTAMSESQDGSLYYFDTEVVSLGPEAAFNITNDTYLTLEPGTFECFGWLHQVADPTLTYSMEEEGTITMPVAILPVGSADSPANLLNLVGAPVEVDYEQAPVVQQIQQFLDSADDRVTSANMLARHFLPSYLSFDATYSGGTAPSSIATTIINYINTLPVETPADVAVIEGFIDAAGGDPVVPNKLVAVLHDWNRQRWYEYSLDKIGGSTTLVPYAGTPRVSFFVPGPDVSGQNPLPAGERINLTQT